MQAIQHTLRVLQAVRRQAPLVHNITNFVVMNNSANAVLAIGASPAMVHSPDEVEAFTALSGALVVNIGTLSSPWVAAMKLAVASAAAHDVPWVLDPVGAGATAYRRGVAADLAARGPRVIRGNASEILTLAGAQGAAGKGVDAGDSSNDAVQAAHALARASGAVVAMTGAVDYVCDGRRTAAIAAGHPLMARVTGLGCSLTAVTAAFIAAESDAFVAAAAALTAFAAAGQAAAARARGPGSLQLELLDALYKLDQSLLLAQIAQDWY